MREKPFAFDPGAALLLGFLLFTLRWQELLALVAAASVHEFGHWICLKWMHIPVFGFSLSLSGPVLYCGDAGNITGQIIAALSGPAAGIVLWLFFETIWPLCAELSLFLSLTNLLPILPLDGGRALSAIFRSQSQLFAFGFIAAAAVMILGLCVLKAGRGFGILLFGFWLLLLACQGSENDVQ